MFRNQMGIIAAMESADNEGVDLNEVESAETATAVSEDTAALTTEATGIDAEAASIGDAVDSGEQLEEIAEVATDAVDSGEGMDETAAAMASIAIENIRNRLGFRGVQRVVPALESFGNSNTKLVSTRLVIEGIGDTLKSIWAAIKAAVIRLWDKIKSFFANLFNSATMLTKHIEGLRKRARDMAPGVKPMEKKLKSSSIAQAFSVKGKADFSTVGIIEANSKTLSVVAKKISELQRTTADSAKTLASGEINDESVKKWLGYQSGQNSAIKEAVSKAYSSAKANDELAAISTAIKSKKGSKETKEGWGPFVGGVNLVATTTEDTILDVQMARTKLTFEAAKGKAATEVAALELSEVQDILGKAVKMAAEIQDFKKTQGDYDDMTKSIVKSAEQIMNSTQKILNKTGSSTSTNLGLAEVKTEINNSIAMMNSFGSRGPALKFACAKAMADYASISMRNLREGK